jgi:hypothetical protein
MAWDARAALTQLGVLQVQPIAWEQVLEAEQAWTLEVDIGDVMVEWDELDALRKGLRESKAEELWPVLHEKRGEGPSAMTSLRGLICVLCSSPTPEALACYMDLLAIPGAEGNGAFRPAIFRQVIAAMKALRAGEEEDQANLVLLQAVARWASLVNIQDEAFSQTLGAVASIVRAPASPAVQTAALEAACGLLSKQHGDIRKVFLTVCKDLLPAGVMVGEGMRCAQGSHVTKAMHAIRKQVLGVLASTLRKYPELSERVEAKTEEESPGAAGAVADPVVVMLQHWVFWTPDRTDWRVATAESVVTLLKACPEESEVVRRFAPILSQFMVAEKTAARLLAIDVSLAVADAFPGKVSVQAQILARCRDIAPTVRARAFSGLGSLVNMEQDGGDEQLKDMLTNRDSEKFVDVAALFEVHVADPKPMVRKAAVAVFEAMIPFLINKVGLSQEDASVFFDIRICASRTADESVMVRKAACGAMCKVLTLCSECPHVLAAWGQYVLPLVQDPEQSVADRGLDEVERHVFNPLADWFKTHNQLDQVGVFLLLAHIGGNSDALEYLLRAWRLSYKRSEAKANVAAQLPVLEAIRRAVELVHVSAESPPSAIHCGMSLWSLAEEAVAVDKANLNPEVALKAWQRCEDSSEDERVVLFAVRILRIVEKTASALTEEVRQELAQRWAAKIIGSACPPALVSEMVRALDAAKPGAAKDLLPGFAMRITAFACGTTDIDDLGAALFATGEIVLQTNAPISDRVVTAVQTIATNTILVDGIRVLIPEEVRGHAVICWGKMCLKDDILAKKSVEALVLHLSDGECFTVRNNILLVLADLCVMYTSLVDRFVPMLTNCLNADHELLRKHAAMVLSHLLSEDFIKFKGSIQHRFLFALADPSDYVRDFVEAVFERILLHRILVPSTCFVDAIAALNGWMAHPMYQGAKGNQNFCLAHDPERRRRVYVFLLNLMSNEQKFATQASIVTNLLATFADDQDDATSVKLPTSYDDPAGKVLCDCFNLLACKEIKVNFARSGQDGGEDGDGGDMGDAPKADAQAAAKDKVISVLLRRHMAESTMPILIQLKNLLESTRSPFQREYRFCQQEILKDFREDLNAVLGGNTQLIREIEFDERLETGFHQADTRTNPHQETRKPLSLQRLEPLPAIDGLQTPRRESGSHFQSAPRLSGSAVPYSQSGTRVPKVVRTGEKAEPRDTPARAGTPAATPAPNTADVAKNIVPSSARAERAEDPAPDAAAPDAEKENEEVFSTQQLDISTQDVEALLATPAKTPASALKEPPSARASVLGEQNHTVMESEPA